MQSWAHISEVKTTKTTFTTTDEISCPLITWHILWVWPGIFIECHSPLCYISITNETTAIITKLIWDYTLLSQYGRWGSSIYMSTHKQIISNCGCSVCVCVCVSLRAVCFCTVAFACQRCRMSDSKRASNCWGDRFLCVHICVCVCLDAWSKMLGMQFISNKLSGCSLTHSPALWLHVMSSARFHEVITLCLLPESLSASCLLCIFLSLLLVDFQSLHVSQIKIVCMHGKHTDVFLWYYWQLDISGVERSYACSA